MANIPCVVVKFVSQPVNFRKSEFLRFSDAEHLLPLGVGEELAVFVEKFQRVPLHGVVRCGEDNAAAGALADNGDFGGGGGCQPDIHHIEAHGAERAGDERVDHLARQTGVAADND